MTTDIPVIAAVEGFRVLVSLKNLPQISLRFLIHITLHQTSSARAEHLRAFLQIPVLGTLQVGTISATCGSLGNYLGRFPGRPWTAWAAVSRNLVDAMLPLPNAPRGTRQSRLPEGAVKTASKGENIWWPSQVAKSPRVENTDESTSRVPNCNPHDLTG